MDDWTTWPYNSTAFRVSDADNVLTVVGCGTLGYIGSQEGAVEYRYVMGCNASCSAGPLAGGGAASAADCDGTDGCCSTTIQQKGIRSYDFGFTGSNDDDDGSAGFGSRCGYAFLVERNTFKFGAAAYDATTSELMNASRGGGREPLLPLVLDWAVGNLTCAEAEAEAAARKNKTPFACVSENSVCVNSTNGLGYLCNCSSGYRGNPYVEHGCIAFDECKEMSPPCPPNIKCKNTKGGPRCVPICPVGKRSKAYGNDGECEIDLSTAAIGISVGVVVVSVVLSCTYAIQEKKRLAAIKQRYFKQHGGQLLFEELRSQARQQQVRSFTIFTKTEVEEATGRFDERHVLGKGGNGTVYRGALRDGRAVAIKRCRVAADERQRREFGKEVLILSQVNHRNIVKLYGCCLEVEVPMLVYQFIPNGTLSDLLHGRASGGSPPPFPFAVRLKIAQEAAEALAYLHCMASPPIIHGDVKPANILLDEAFAAKVSDFGASVLAPTDEAHLVTLVQGTCGYLDPEYMQTCRLTDRSDVYSFGVVLLELLTRRRALVLAAPDEERSLAAHFLAATRDGGGLDGLLDDGIRGEVTAEVLEMFAELAKRCLEMSGEKRPSMREVAEELDRIRKLLCRHDAELHKEIL